MFPSCVWRRRCYRYGKNEEPFGHIEQSTIKRSSGEIWDNRYWGKIDLKWTTISEILMPKFMLRNVFES